jgi:hypothetical protein
MHTKARDVIFQESHLKSFENQRIYEIHIIGRLL